MNRSRSPSPEDEDDGAVQSVVGPTIEIMGLELLMMPESGFQSSCDFSFDSYAQDSLGPHRGKTLPRHHPSNEGAPHIRVIRRMSNCSSIGVESYGYGEDDIDCGDSSNMLQVHRRASMGSANFANDGYEYGRYKATRRSSLGSYANDSLAGEHQRYASQRRGSRMVRRGSVGSYAADSLCGRQNRNRYNGVAKTQRRSSIGSYAADSLVGRYKATRRSSIGSYEDDSFNFNSSFVRKNHAADDSSRNCSSFADFANDSFVIAQGKNDMLTQSTSVQPAKGLSIMKRRLSNESMYSFPPEVLETQSINDGGAARVA